MFLKYENNINKLMTGFIFASIPGIIVQIYVFGIGIIYQIFLAIITAIVSEVLVLYLRNLPIFSELKNNSSLVTGFILAIIIPPLSPWWIIIVGTAFAILVVKHVYGGLGHNIFNPAMMSYLVLLISFPLHMTYWLPVVDIQYNYVKYDFFYNLKIIFHSNVIKEDILNQLKLLHEHYHQSIKSNIFETKKLIIFIIGILKRSELHNLLIGINWKLVNIAYFFGGLIMLYRKIIKWYIPISCLVTLTLCSWFSWFLSPTEYYSPIIHLFLGETMFGIFFIITDPVTSPISKYNNILYGILIGFLIWIIRVYFGYYDGVVFAVLLGNIMVLFIDYYINLKFMVLNKK